MRAIFLLLGCSALGWSGVDASRWGVKAASDSVAATVLREEVQKRSGLKLGSGPEIELVVNTNEAGIDLEGYALQVDEKRARIAGRTERGLLFGVGALLRAMDWGPGKLELPHLNRRTSPESMLRGHQLGYRATANSWDAWTVAQFDQYIRELVLFGANAVENIPFQDTKAAPLMKVSRKEMHRAMSRICRKYDIEYWVWTPADFELSDGDKRTAFLKDFAEMAQEAERLDGVFVPGGDPGHNAPELVMPFLEDLAQRTKAKIWLSLQGFNREREDYVYRWIADKRPKWLGGLVAGPSSPPALRSRAALPAEYGLRLYPDLTHNKICQYQVPGLDQAIAMTLGREAINPRAAEMVKIHNLNVGTSVGFLSYSDGVHDDVNKTVFSALGWHSHREAREILIEYARLFFSSKMATEIADGILALERNWRGPLVENGNVEATLREWDRLSAALPELAGNWRWQMNQLRAVYDAHSRRRLIEERGLEEAANAVMLDHALPSGERIDRALALLAKASGQKQLRTRIVELCEKLFQSISLQTSVDRYGASGAERGAVMDFIDTPLNNRWWLEDELSKVKQLGSEPLRLARLREIASWESPGPGSFYDDVGNEGRSPHTEMDERDEPLFWWLDQGRSRLRLSAQTTMWPKRLLYEGVKAGAKYVVRTGGQGQSLLKVDGVRVGGKQAGEFWDFEVPAQALADGRLELTWDVPTDEGHLNWRQRSRLAEVWLLKKN